MKLIGIIMVGVAISLFLIYAFSCVIDAINDSRNKIADLLIGFTNNNRNKDIIERLERLEKQYDVTNKQLHTTQYWINQLSNHLASVKISLANMSTSDYVPKHAKKEEE